ncbi:hypothetical protein KUTeg_013598 [Tegillarca granosa]|uniref:Uncharacterized protein n=1 Tax=Tegillarca granosa TaxID=220873 RepID=A0ABQ9EU58_TEGGR|nr:hypothetical protein KUTeg_013598 [Tegillarca granosa]
MKSKGAGIQNHNDHDFVFDGGLHSNSRAAIVKEILIYLLYERQQIPLPFEHIKRELKVMRENEENDTDKSVRLCFSFAGLVKSY